MCLLRMLQCKFEMNTTAFKVLKNILIKYIGINLTFILFENLTSFSTFCQIYKVLCLLKVISNLSTSPTNYQFFTIGTHNILESVAIML